jgi:GMC oxidoreductase
MEVSMSPFSARTYPQLITQQSSTQARLFPQFGGTGSHFDVIVAGSGVGGGILADDLADRFASTGSGKRILVLEAGSYLFPTHVFNVCRFPNADVARAYAVQTFTQAGGPTDRHYIHERPQLNFGGRSVFWSGLIPTIQPWELEFFPQTVRDGIASRVDEVGRALNASVTMGERAQAIVQALGNSPLAGHFEVRETPRALHQPYLTAAGSPASEFWTESTGVFNTAELLTNQIGLASGDAMVDSTRRPSLLLNHYLESVTRGNDGRYVLEVQDTIGNTTKQFTADTVVLAAGTIESPKILRRSPVFDALPDEVRGLVGKGLTDHPTTAWVEGLVTGIDGIDIPRDCHAKIIFYSKGLRESDGSITYPFNVEMNINHEYWHLRENDPTSPAVPVLPGDQSLMEVKFSFGNCLDDENVMLFEDPLSSPYLPQIRFKNLSWMDDLAANRFPALAGWPNQSFADIFAVLNRVTQQIFSQFSNRGQPTRPRNECWYGDCGKGFGYGTVHHCVGTLRMPAKTRLDAPGFATLSVVDENLQVHGHPGLYVCDMSVMPFSSAANPVGTLAALALRLSDHLATA